MPHCTNLAVFLNIVPNASYPFPFGHLVEKFRPFRGHLLSYYEFCSWVWPPPPFFNNVKKAAILVKRGIPRQHELVCYMKCVPTVWPRVLLRPVYDYAFWRVVIVPLSTLSVPWIVRPKYMLSRCVRTHLYVRVRVRTLKHRGLICLLFTFGLSHTGSQGANQL